MISRIYELTIYLTDTYEPHQAHQPNSYLAADSSFGPAHNASDDARHATVARDDTYHAADHHRKEYDRCPVKIGDPGTGAGWSDYPSSRRAMTCAWISAAPSKMFRIRASQSTRLIGYSIAKPLPP